MTVGLTVKRVLPSSYERASFVRYTLISEMFKREKEKCLTLLAILPSLEESLSEE